ncbi:hypothetical protein LCGC14_1780490 [marine sediment metagenome]|uniref:Uncharacterized protein n=1 Tax=marine sediment metagenome TaxID=412755 RepID=A0A0F9GVQ2_9ZZZZ
MRYVFETTYIIDAPDEATARETIARVELPLGLDPQVVEHFTRLIAKRRVRIGEAKESKL